MVIGGVERKAHYFVLYLPHSDGCFVKAYPAETTEAFCDSHISAFAFLGGVPQSITYDNTRLAAAMTLGDGWRKRTRSFSELQSHYLFEVRFGRQGRGKVEGMVGYVRRNFLVPLPSVKGGEKVYHCGGGIVYHRHDEKGLNWEPGGIRSGAGVRSSGVSQESTGSSDTWEAALCRLCLRR